MIPKRIICTHVSRSAINASLQRCIERMEALHPDWEVTFFSDGDCLDFVHRECAEYRELYEWYPRAVMKADFFRILVVWKLGGFYFDSDVWLTQRLDALCRSRAVFPWEWVMPQSDMAKRYPRHLRGQVEPPQVGNYAFGATRGHPFLAAILEEMVRRTGSFEAEACNDLNVLHATGPDVVTSVYYRDRERWEDVDVLPGDPTLTGPQPPLSADSPRDWQRFGSYGSHLLAGGWLHGK